MGDLLDGTIKATDAHEIRNARGELLRIEYDDPDGVGSNGPRGERGTR